MPQPQPTYDMPAAMPSAGAAYDGQPEGRYYGTGFTYQSEPASFIQPGYGDTLRVPEPWQDNHSATISYSSESNGELTVVISCTYTDGRCQLYRINPSRRAKIPSLPVSTTVTAAVAALSCDVRLSPHHLHKLVCNELQHTPMTCYPLEIHWLFMFASPL